MSDIGLFGNFLRLTKDGPFLGHFQKILLCWNYKQETIFKGDILMGFYGETTAGNSNKNFLLRSGILEWIPAFADKTGSLSPGKRGMTHTVWAPVSLVENV